jgi:hypothetical protein
VSEMEAPIDELTQELADFIQTVLIDLWETRTGDEQKWCQEWWKHPEALNRILDIYQGWNLIGDTPDDLSLNAWYRFYLDHHLPILLAESGPFRSCAFAHTERTALQWVIPE